MRLPHGICSVAVGAEVLAGLGAAAFYAHLMGLLPGANGIDGLAAALFSVALVICLAYSAVAATVLVLTVKRVRIWPFLAPVPALVATLLFGGWLLSGDPGDEYWLGPAVTVHAVLLVVTVLSASYAVRWNTSD